MVSVVLESEGEVVREGDVSPTRRAVLTKLRIRALTQRFRETGAPEEEVQLDDDRARCLLTCPRQGFHRVLYHLDAIAGLRQVDTEEDSEVFMELRDRRYGTVGAQESTWLSLRESLREVRALIRPLAGRCHRRARLMAWTSKSSAPSRVPHPSQWDARSVLPSRVEPEPWRSARLQQRLPAARTRRQSAAATFAGACRTEGTSERGPVSCARTRDTASTASRGS